jgi:hypothetical protein
MSLFKWRVKKGDFIGIANYEEALGDWVGVAFFIL